MINSISKPNMNIFRVMAMATLAGANHGTQRVAANTKAGRKVMAASSFSEVRYAQKLAADHERDAWNKRVDDEKAAKAKARSATRNAAVFMYKKETDHGTKP